MYQGTDILDHACEKSCLVGPHDAATPPPSPAPWRANAVAVRRIAAGWLAGGLRRSARARADTEPDGGNGGAAHPRARARGGRLRRDRGLGRSRGRGRTVGPARSRGGGGSGRHGEARRPAVAAGCAHAAGPAGPVPGVRGAGRRQPGRGRAGPGVPRNWPKAASSRSKTPSRRRPRRPVPRRN